MAFYSEERKPSFDGPRKFGKRGGKEGNFGGGHGFGGRDGGRDGGRSAMFQAVCNKCGNDCQVPFRPSGDRPVFCSNCFEKKAPVRSDRFERSDRPTGKSFGRPDYGNKPRREFEPNRGSVGSDRQTENFKDQFALMNAKLDKIMQALTAPTGRTETARSAEETEEMGEAVAPVKVRKARKVKSKKK